MKELQITTEELRRRLPEVLVQVQGAGQTYEVTHYRRPVFRIVPVEVKNDGERLARNG